MTLWCTAHSDAGPSTSTFGTQVITKVPVTTTYAMTFAPGKSVVDLQVGSVREGFALHCCRDVWVRTTWRVSLVGLDSEEAASNYKHEGTSKDLPREFWRDWACCGGHRVTEVLLPLSMQALFSTEQHHSLTYRDVPVFLTGITSLRAWQTRGPAKVLKKARRFIIARFLFFILRIALAVLFFFFGFSEVHTSAQMFVILKMRFFSSGSTSVC